MFLFSLEIYLLEILYFEMLLRLSINVIMCFPSSFAIYFLRLYAHLNLLFACITSFAVHTYYIQTHLVHFFFSRVTQVVIKQGVKFPFCKIILANPAKHVGKILELFYLGKHLVKILSHFYPIQSRFGGRWFLLRILSLFLLELQLCQLSE